MSWEAVAEASKASGISSNAKFVLMTLANFSDENGIAFPSYRTICRITLLSDSSVRRAISELEGAGLISKYNRFTEGRQTSNSYQVLPKVQGGGVHTDHPGVFTQTTPGVFTQTTHRIKEEEPKKENSAEQVVAAGKAGLSSQQVIDLYHQELPSCRRVKVWTKAREHALRARLKEDKQRLDPEWWRALFQYCSGQDFLMTGQWFDLEWLLRPTNFAKLVEGRYENA